MWHKTPIILNWRFVFGNLNHSEVATLWKITKKHGRPTPLLMVEDPNTPGDLQEALHYGTLSELNAYERRNTSKNPLGIHHPTRAITKALSIKGEGPTSPHPPHFRH